ncbi:MAG: tetratricopeptide repeat protein [Bacteroidota bacterium]
MRIGIFAPVVFMSFLIISSCTKDESVSRMPVTADSELALELYETGMLAFDQVKMEPAFQNLEMAVKEDPDFFMAYFWIYFMSGKSTVEVAEKAFQSESDLNDGEIEIKRAFKYMLDGQEGEAVSHLKRAVDLYPMDPHIHKILYIFQFQYMKDVEGAVVSMNRAIEALPEYALTYNQLGYALMNLGKYDQAEEAFDTYIRLSPDIANPYDSKGDFYMSTGRYEDAYDSYMKAYELDSGFRISEKKAQKAMYLLENSETP